MIALLQLRAAYDEARLRICQEAGSAETRLLKSEANVKLEARQGYINANANLVSNYYDYFISLAALDRAIGR